MDKNKVIKIANLAKLRLSDEEVDLFLKQFQDFLKYIDQLNETTLENVEPYLTPITEKLREDVINSDNYLEKNTILDMASNHDSNYIIVSKVSVK